MMNNSQYIAIDDDRKPIGEAVEELQTYTEGGRKAEFIMKLMRRLKGMLDFSWQFDENGKMDPKRRKLTYEEIFGEENQNNEGKFNPPITYHGYKMAFLKEQKSLLLPDMVKLQKVKFGFQISQLTERNIQFLKDELNQIDTEIETDIPFKRSFYIRATDLNCYDKSGNPCMFAPDGMVKAKLLLQGYKIKNEIKVPVWKLLDVFNCY